MTFLSGKTKLSVINVGPYSGVPLHILHSATVKIEIHNKKYTQKYTTKGNTADFVAINHVFITMCLLNKS